MADGTLYHGVHAVSLALLHHPDDGLSTDPFHKKDSGGIYAANRCGDRLMYHAETDLALG